MPELKERHLKRMVRSRFRLGMPQTVDFVTQDVLKIGEKSGERIIFSRGTKRSRNLNSEVEEFNQVGPIRHMNVDAGSISARDGELHVEGIPSDINVRVLVSPSGYATKREQTTNYVQNLIGPKIPVKGSLDLKKL